MRLIALSFLAGILLCYALPSFPQPWWSLTIVPLIGIGLWWPRWRFLWFIPVGFMWMLWHSLAILSQQLPVGAEGKNIAVVGRLIGLPKQKYHKQTSEYHWQFDFQVEQGVKQALIPSFPRRLRLNWYEPPADLALQPGQQWQLQVRLKPPRSNLNPHTHDYSATLFANRIRARGYVYIRGSPPRLLNDRLNWYSFNHWGMQLDRLRYRIALQLQTLLAGYTSQGTLIALAIGERQWLDHTDYRVLRDSGTAHLIAISGLHIGIIAGFGYFLGSFAWRRSTHAMLWLPVPRFAALIAITFAVFYAFLAGFSVPTQRALVMIVVFMFGHLFGYYLGIGQRIALALFIVLLLQPLSVISAGFWLSFSAVSILAFAFSQRRLDTEGWPAWLGAKAATTTESTQVTVRSRRTLVDTIRTWVVSIWYSQSVVVLGLAPLTLFWFGQVPLLGFVANLLAIPVVTLVVVPLVLLGTTLLWLLPIVAEAILRYTATATDLLLYSLTYFAQPWHTLTLPSWVYLSGMLGVLLVLSPLPKHHLRLWLLSAVYCLPLFFYQPARPAWQQAQFTLLDVGQGLASVIRTRHHTLVYDTGAQFRTGFNFGAAVVVPFLRGEGVHEIDTLLVSHRDTDHAGGAFSVLESLAVTQILTSAPHYFADYSNVVACQAGQRWQWDGVVFEILHPEPDCVGNRNDCSCVLRVSTGEQQLLLTGDIGTEVEHDLVRHYRNGELHADVLVAPHHGSKYASSSEFIAAVQPQYVLFSTNYHNQWGFPRWETRLRYQAQSVKMLSTPDTGAIHFLFSPEQLSAPELTRQRHRRYWH